jgi:hypothetical protein
MARKSNEIHKSDLDKNQKIDPTYKHLQADNGPKQPGMTHFNYAKYNVMSEPRHDSKNFLKLPNKFRGEVRPLK